MCFGENTLLGSAAKAGTDIIVAAHKPTSIFFIFKTVLSLYELF
ncbi:hypothetical protein BLGI_492 [Brevibacillus laterosporus GI-9]|nr:hypothetical protein BLGI_492 [Brevibacillus laterosporus GI-9]